jgi:hypothetical protein
MLPSSYKKRACRGIGMALLIALLGPPLSAQELTQPLTAEEVACNERQLERLLRRMNSAHELYVTPQLPNTLLVSPSGSGGGYAGLVATYEGFRLGLGEGPPTDYFEHYLAFNIVADSSALLLNPGRTPLPQVSLNRENSGTNLVQPGGYFDLTLTLDPGLSGGDPLVINNFSEPRPGLIYNGFRSNSTKPGRGLIEDGIPTRCHDKLTDFDLHIFSILKRVVRTVAMSEFFMPDMETTVFRGEDPHTYRINFYPIYEEFEPRGRMSTEIKVAWTESGRLTTGEARIFPACTVAEQTGCSSLQRSSLFMVLIPPVFGGHEYSDGAGWQEGGFYIWHEGPSDSRLLNFETLLAGTTWNEPVW